jgi:hypothetical protein
MIIIFSIFCIIIAGALFEFGRILMFIAASKGLTGNRDDTDGDKRSGLILLKDEGTGVEYLMSITGHITPRIKNGQVL